MNIINSIEFMYVCALNQIKKKKKVNENSLLLLMEIKTFFYSRDEILKKYLKHI